MSQAKTLAVFYREDVIIDLARLAQIFKKMDLPLICQKDESLAQLRLMCTVSGNAVLES